jgi:hypothetical protein
MDAIGAGRSTDMAVELAQSLGIWSITALRTVGQDTGSGSRKRRIAVIGTSTVDIRRLISRTMRTSTLRLFDQWERDQGHRVPSSHVSNLWG